jgi:hypothetical protein
MQSKEYKLIFWKNQDQFEADFHAAAKEGFTLSQFCPKDQRVIAAMERNYVPPMDDDDNY